MNKDTLITTCGVSVDRYKNIDLGRLAFTELTTVPTESCYLFLHFESGKNLLKCDHSLLSSTLLRCAFYYALQDGFEFEKMDKIIKYDHSN